MSAPSPTPGRASVAVDLRALVGRPTGIGWFTLSLLERLAARRRHRYLGLAHAEPFAAGRLRAAGAEVEAQPTPLGFWWQQLVLPPRLAAGDVDLFWSPITVTPVITPVPAVVTVHDLTPLLLPQAHRLKVRLSVQPFLARSVGRARQVVVDSASTARDLCRRYPRVADRLRVVYPGVDEEFRPAPAGEAAAIRDELGLPQGYLLFAGTLEPRKNVSRLLDVWERLREDDPDFPPLVLCGGYGWSSRDLLDRIRRLEPAGLRYLGHLERERLVRLFRGARAFVYPSLYEGFGLPVAEALACGLPVVTSDRSSLPEVVGDAALTCDPEDTAALAAALCRVVSEPALARELGERARERARRFDWTAAARQMEEVFARALE